MNVVKYLPTVPEDPPPPSTLSQWSFGIAMFAAFVIPFVLLVTSARYRQFADQAVLRLRGTTHLQSIQDPSVGYKTCARAALEQRARDAQQLQP